MDDTRGDGHACEIGDGQQCIHCGITMTDDEGIAARSQPDWKLG